MCHSLHVASKDNLQEMSLPSTMWDHQIKVRSSGEAASAFYPLSPPWPIDLTVCIILNLGFAKTFQNNFPVKV